jgi:hypothetical protein
MMQWWADYLDTVDKSAATMESGSNGAG